MTEEALYRELLATAGRAAGPGVAGARPVTDYAALSRPGRWRQAWDFAARSAGPPREIEGTVWSDAVERCLAENGSVYIPRMEEPVWIDRPIVLHSGARLAVHPETEVRLAGAPGTCMVRNAAAAILDRPVAANDAADEDIVVEGGIWSDCRNDGRGRGGAIDPAGPPGSMGVFVFSGVRRIAVRNAVFRDSSAFAVQIGNAADFVVEDIRFDETADGIHVEGPAERGIVRRVSGKTNDDAVALNAWDWESSSLTFGPITDVLVEDVALRPGYLWSELRLLPGTKVFPGGETVACDIRRCVFRGIRGIHTFKMYDQPNISKPEEDFSDPIGRMAGLFFSDIEADAVAAAEYYDPSAEALFEICADIEDISIRGVRFNYVPGERGARPYLVSVGPKALTWPRGRTPAEGWKEVFNPEANPVVKRLTVADIRVPDPAGPGARVPVRDAAALVHARRLTPNPDFPRTMPRGGTGCGRIEAVLAG